MADLIAEKYQGSTITLCITGLPVTITGEVLIGTPGSVTLKLKDGKITHITDDLIAFFF